MKLKSLFFRFWPIIVIFFLVFVFFWKFFFKGLIPVPGDIIAGMYLPWLDYKWGYVVGVPVKNSLLSDAVSQFWIWRNLAIDLFRSGQSPFWNPYSFCGSPLVPVFHSSFFSPFNLFFFLFSKYISMGLIIVFQPLLASIFMYFLLRSYKLSLHSSLFGGIVFGFSGFMLTWLEWGNVGHTLLWLPFFIWSTEKYAVKKQKVYLLLLIFSLGISLSGGHPQTFFYCFLTWFLYFVWRLKENKLLKNILLALGVSIFFFFCFSFLIFPAAESFWYSIRGSEKYISQHNYGFFPLLNIITFLAPDFFGNPATGNWWGRGFNYQELVGYFGLIPLALILFTFKLKGEKNIFWKVFFLLSLTLAFKYPFGWLIYFFKIPLLSTASASRILSITSFSGAILSAFSLEKFAKNEIKINFFIFSVLWGIFLGYATAIIISILLVNNYLSSGIEDVSIKSISPFMLNLKVAIRNMILPFGVFTIFTFIVLVKQKFSKSIFLKQVFLLATLGLTVLELFRYGWKYNPFTKPELYFPSTPLTDYLQKSVFIDRIERERGEILPPNMWIPYGLYSASGYDPVYPLYYAKYLMLLSGGDIETNGVSRYGEIENYDLPFYDLLGIKFLTAIKRDEISVISKEGKTSYKFDINKFNNIFEADSVAVLENKEVFPRVFLTDKVFVSNNDLQTFQEMKRNNLNLKTTAFLTGTDLIGSQINKTSGIFQNSKAEIENYQSGKVEINTYSPNEKFLVLTDTFFPGWKALIDNRKTSIYRADLSFRGVLVPEGNHKISFIYKPLSYKIGFIFSLSSLVLLVAVILIKKLPLFKNKKT